MWTSGACGAAGGNVVLLRGRGFELHDEVGGYPAAVFDVDALASGPVADFGESGSPAPGLRRDRAGRRVPGARLAASI